MKPHADLEELLESCPPRDSRWRHYKTGDIYTVTGSAVYSNPKHGVEEPVVLCLLFGDTVQLAKPLREWMEEVTYTQKVDGERLVVKVQRYERVDG